MKIVAAGASGLIGTPLVASLREAGHEVVTLVRRPPERAGEFQWSPSDGLLPGEALEGIDAAINLAGAGIGDRRWTESYKELLVSSRLDCTKTLATALAKANPHAALVQGSAMGYYGNDRGQAKLTETSRPGTDFLADLCVKWEAAADPAREAGCRVTYLRTGLVMTPKGGSFGKLMPLFKTGLAGPLGDGKMWWSWITLPDMVGAIQFLLNTDIEGPVNLASPDPATNRDVTKALAHAMKRPSFLPVPKFALQTVLGELAENVLASQRLVPNILLDAGFPYQHPNLQVAADWFADEA